VNEKPHAVLKTKFNADRALIERKRLMPAATVSHQRRTQVHAYLDTMEGHMGLEMDIVACTTHFFTHAFPSLSSSFSHPKHTQTTQKK
jgi:hypothetical protein